MPGVFLCLGFMPPGGASSGKLSTGRRIQRKVIHRAMHRVESYPQGGASSGKLSTGRAVGSSAAVSSAVVTTDSDRCRLVIASSCCRMLPGSHTSVCTMPRCSNRSRYFEQLRCVLLRTRAASSSLLSFCFFAVILATYFVLNRRYYSMNWIVIKTVKRLSLDVLTILIMGVILNLRWLDVGGGRVSGGVRHLVFSSRKRRGTGSRGGKGFWRWVANWQFRVVKSSSNARNLIC